MKRGRGLDQDGRPWLVTYSSGLLGEKSTSTAEAAAAWAGSALSRADTTGESLQDFVFGGVDAGASKVMASLACIQSGRISSRGGTISSGTAEAAASTGADFHSRIAAESVSDNASSAGAGMGGTGACSTSPGAWIQGFFFWVGRWTWTATSPVFQCDGAFAGGAVSVGLDGGSSAVSSSTADFSTGTGAGFGCSTEESVSDGSMGTDSVSGIACSSITVENDAGIAGIDGAGDPSSEDG